MVGRAAFFSSSVGSLIVLYVFWMSVDMSGGIYGVRERVADEDMGFIKGCKDPGMEPTFLLG